MRDIVQEINDEIRRVTGNWPENQFCVDLAARSVAAITALRAEVERLLEVVTAHEHVIREQEDENEKLRAALESIADLPPGYADMRQDDLVVILANKARAALEER